MTLQLDKAERRESTRATLAAIARHGFYLTHAAMHTMPIENASFTEILASEPAAP
jgi:hypothetical protein